MMNGITKPDVWKPFLPCDHTATNLADALNNIWQTWKPSEEEQMSITTDNGTNIINAANILEWQRLLCFGYNFNLAVNNSLKNDNRITRALKVACSIVSAFLLA